MLVLALDTTTRAGSVALVEDGMLRDVFSGDPLVTHGQRLPRDITTLLDQTHTRLDHIDLFAVAAGPGSFTGLRIGIAAMQGFALAHGRSLAGVSALDALEEAMRTESAIDADVPLAVWMDAHRGEVFTALYRHSMAIDGPTVGTPEQVLSRWRSGDRQAPAVIGGDGALVYAAAIRRELPGTRVLERVPLMAPAIGRLATRQAASSATWPSPDAIQPIYVRRPDAELARDRAHQ